MWIVAIVCFLYIALFASLDTVFVYWVIAYEPVKTARLALIIETVWVSCQKANSLNQLLKGEFRTRRNHCDARFAGSN